MSKAHNYNQYPEGFLEPFDKPVTFKLINIKPDPENEGAWLMPMFCNVPATSRVTAKDGTVVDLALIRNVTPDGEIQLGIEELLLGQMNNGEIQLDPKNPSDRAKFDYLNHCQWNRDSPYTYEGAEHIVYKFDPEAIAKDASKERSIKRDALSAAISLSEDRVKAVYAKIGSRNPNSLKVAQMRDEIEELALDIPERVLAAIGKKASDPVDLLEVNDEVVVEDVVSLAIKTGKLKKYNPGLVWRTQGGLEIFKFARVSAGKGTPEKQLLAAAEDDAELFAVIHELTK